jgi:RimJ/RimL family protein N-acetyltransferase
MNRPDAILLQTPRLLLRQFTLDDADRLVELDSDPEVMRFISKGQPTPLARYRDDLLPRWIAGYATDPHRGFWAAHAADSHAFLGWFHLRPDRYDAGAQELGYRLRREAWGRGLATEGSHALLDRAFREWLIERVCARALVTNLASIRVMEKCGLKFESHFVFEETLLPGWAEDDRKAVKYGLNREEYQGLPRD